MAGTHKFFWGVFNTFYFLPASLWKVPTSLWKVPASLWKVPASLWKVPASLWKVPASLWKVPASMEGTCLSIEAEMPLGPKIPKVHQQYSTVQPIFVTVHSAKNSTLNSTFRIFLKITHFILSGVDFQLEILSFDTHSIAASMFLWFQNVQHCM